MRTRHLVGLAAILFLFLAGLAVVIDSPILAQDSIFRTFLPAVLNRTPLVDNAYPPPTGEQATIDHSEGKHGVCNEPDWGQREFFKLSNGKRVACMHPEGQTNGRPRPPDGTVYGWVAAEGLWRCATCNKFFQDIVPAEICDQPPPTPVPPTGVPPTAVPPPTSVPPTSVPPTSVPPTSVPPTSVPPTSVPPPPPPPICIDSTMLDDLTHMPRGTWVREGGPDACAFENRPFPGTNDIVCPKGDFVGEFVCTVDAQGDVVVHEGIDQPVKIFGATIRWMPAYAAWENVCSVWHGEVRNWRARNDPVKPRFQPVTGGIQTCPPAPY